MLLRSQIGARVCDERYEYVNFVRPTRRLQNGNDVCSKAISDFMGFDLFDEGI